MFDITSKFDYLPQAGLAIYFKRQNTFLTLIQLS